MRERFNFSRKERQILLLSVFFIFLAQTAINIYKNRTIDSSLDYHIIQFDSASTHYTEVAPIEETLVKPRVENQKIEKPRAHPQARTITKPQANKEANASNTTITIDVNAADSKQWQELKGIGPAYSKRILAFRNALGGFYSVDQIAETYYLPDSVFTSIKDHLQLRTPHQSFDPNINCLDTSFSHPYIAPWELQWIREHINETGRIESLNEFRELFGHKMKSGKQIEHYLSF